MKEATGFAAVPTGFSSEQGIWWKCFSIGSAAEGGGMTPTVNGSGYRV